MNKTLETMTRDERSLLLYFESRAVDNSGRIDMRRMNKYDREIAEKWNSEGFARFGRIAAEYLTDQGTHWCHLSDEAWRLVHAERKARAAHTWENRRWQTTEEERAA